MDSLHLETVPDYIVVNTHNNRRNTLRKWNSCVNNDMVFHQLSTTEEPIIHGRVGCLLQVEGNTQAYIRRLPDVKIVRRFKKNLKRLTKIGRKELK